MTLCDCGTSSTSSRHAVDTHTHTHTHKQKIYAACSIRHHSSQIRKEQKSAVATPFHFSQNFSENRCGLEPRCSPCHKRHITEFLTLQRRHARKAYTVHKCQKSKKGKREEKCAELRLLLPPLLQFNEFSIQSLEIPLSLKCGTIYLLYSNLKAPRCSAHQEISLKLRRRKSGIHVSNRCAAGRAGRRLFRRRMSPFARSCPSRLFVASALLL